MERPDSTGKTKPVWDDRPAGLIIYTADGQMSAQLYDTRRPRLGATTLPQVAQGSLAGVVTYFGTYTIDRHQATVTHSVVGAMVPDWAGTRLVRAYKFLTPDRLELRVVVDASGRSVTDGTVLVWERIRGR
jgi:hypothetical protein